MEVSIMREEFDLENRQKLLYKEDASLKEYHFNIQGISEGMAEALKPFAMAVVEYEEPGNHHLAAEMNALQLLEAGRKMCCTAVGEVLGNEWVKITEALTAIDPVLSNFIVPKCIYRGGICTEDEPCGYNGNALIQMLEQVPEKLYREVRNRKAVHDNNQKIN